MALLEQLEAPDLWENTGKSTSGPKEGHRGGSIQWREQAEQFLDMEQAAAEAVQLA